MVDVIVTENINGPPLRKLGEDFKILHDATLWQRPNELHGLLADTRALIVRNQTQVDEDLLRAAPNLQIVARAGVGLDNIDVAAASRQGVVVTFTPAANAVSVAELTLGLIFALARNLVGAHIDTVAGGWDRAGFTGIELFGKTLGLVGFGRIGQLVAHRARGLDMRIVITDPLITADAAEVTAINGSVIAFDELLAISDVVSVHTPLTPDTKGLFGRHEFQSMKNTALLVNTARGEVIHEEELFAALRAGELQGAALDVRCQEPPGESKLGSLPNVITTPHIAAFTEEAQLRVVESVCTAVVRVLESHEPTEWVNFSRPRRPSS